MRIQSSHTCSICLDPDNSCEQIAPHNDANGRKHPLHKRCLEHVVLTESSTPKCPTCRTPLDSNFVAATRKKQNQNERTAVTVGMLLLTLPTLLAMSYTAFTWHQGWSAAEKVTPIRSAKLLGSLTGMLAIPITLIVAGKLLDISSHALHICLLRFTHLNREGLEKIATVANGVLGCTLGYRALYLIPKTAAQISTLIGLTVNKAYAHTGDQGLLIAQIAIIAGALWTTPKIVDAAESKR